MNELQPDAFSLRSQLSRYTRHLPFLLICMFISLGLAIGYIFFKTPSYNIYASIVIEDEKKGETLRSPLKEMDFFDETRIVDNESEIIRSKQNLIRVVKSLNLGINYYGLEYNWKKIPLNYSNPIAVRVDRTTEKLYTTPLDIELVDDKTFRLLNNKKTYSFDTPVIIEEASFIVSKTPFFATNKIKKIRTTVSSDEYAAQQLRSRINITQTSKSASMLNLVLSHPVPAQGIDIMNKVISEYNEANLNFRNDQTRATLNLIGERLKLITDQLTTIETDEQKYKSKKGITELSADAQLFLTKVRENDNRISQALIQKDILGQVKSYAEGKSGPSSLPASGIQDPVLVNLINKASQLEMDRQELLKTLGPSHPTLQVKNSQLSEIRNSIADNIHSQQNALDATLNQLNIEKNRVDGQIRSVPLNERNLTQIIRDKSIHESIYAYLLEKREEANIASTAAFSHMRVVDPAYSSMKPVKPDKMLVLLTASFLGLVIPVCFINLRHALNNKINSARQLNHHRLSLLASIPFSAYPSKRLFLNNGQNVFAEQFRHLRATLCQDPEHPHVMIVTSSIAQEGKSFVTVNLAESLSISGNSVVVVDADLRKPKLHKWFNTTNDKGLGNYLLDHATTAEDIIQKVNGTESGPAFIAAGMQPDNPVESLMHSRMNELFTALKQKFDYVIVKAPPAKLVSDAFVLSRFADAVLYIVRHGYTPARYLSFIRDNFHSTGKKVLVVFNGVPKKDVIDKSIYSYGYTSKGKKKISTTN